MYIVNKMNNDRKLKYLINLSRSLSLVRDISDKYVQIQNDSLRYLVPSHLFILVNISIRSMKDAYILLKSEVPSE